MADSYRERLLQAIVAALNGSGKPAGTTVNRSRRRPVELTELPMISVYPIREEKAVPGENRRSPIIERTLRVQVKSRVVGEDAALDPHGKWVVAALLADPSLGDLALDVAEDATDWDADDATDADYSVDATDFLVRYRTSRKNLEVVA